MINAPHKIDVTIEKIELEVHIIHQFLHEVRFFHVYQSHGRSLCVKINFFKVQGQNPNFIQNLGIKTVV